MMPNERGTICVDAQPTVITGGRARKGKLMIPVSDDKYIQPIKRGVSPSELIKALAPCPFCGEVPTLEYGDRLAWVLCPEGTICRSSGMVLAFDQELIEQGVAVWNTRKGG